MATGSKRSVAVKVMVTPELHERLREVAAQLGQAPATVCAMAIGAYVAQLSRSFGLGERMVDAMVKEMGPEMVEQLKLLGGAK